jgi:hypothetical protein
MKTKFVTLAIGLLATTALWASDKPKAAADQTLTAGAYTATAKALVCDGCAAFIKETLEKNKALENVSVESKTKQVSFSVKKDATVKLADLQAVLKAAAGEMGMGADYTLANVKRKAA